MISSMSFLGSCDYDWFYVVEAIIILEYLLIISIGLKHSNLNA